MKQKNITRSSGFLKAIADPTRFKAIVFLGRGARCVGEIMKYTGVEPTLLSHHLKVLRDAGIVKSSREAKYIRYAMQKDAVKKALADIAAGLGIQQ